MSSRANSPDSLAIESEERDGDVEESSDEDTEEASEAETDVGKSTEYTEIKEQMFQDKYANLKKQLQQLKEGTHAEYNRLNKILEAECKARIFLCNVTKTLMMERIERDFVSEIKAAAKECEEKRVELKDTLISEYEEKRRVIGKEKNGPALTSSRISVPKEDWLLDMALHIENERTSLELVGDTNESKPVMTRKLRRRPNDPLPMPEKRRKPPPAQLNYLLDDKEIESDLKAISRGRPVTPHIRRVPLPGLGIPPVSQGETAHEPRIEDGKLRYEKRFFHRGQAVFVGGKDLPRFAANIHNIGTDTIWVKKVSDSSKFRIFLSQLAKKKVHIERRIP